MLALDDAVLEPTILAAQRGDEESWRELIDLCAPLLHASPYGLRPPGWPRCPDVDMDEFRHQARAILFDIVTAYDPRRSRSAAAYLAVHFRQRAQNYLRAVARRQRRVLPLDGPVLDRVLEVAGEERADRSYSDEQVAQLREAMQILSPRQRAILIRYYWREQTLREIAEDMRLSAACVRQHKSRAERALRARLGVVKNRSSRPAPVASPR